MIIFKDNKTIEKLASNHKLDKKDSKIIIELQLYILQKLSKFSIDNLIKKYKKSSLNPYKT